MGQTKLDIRFNRELERYKAGYMLPNEVFHLGKPQGVLQMFLPNLPIVMRPGIMKKGLEKKHDVDIIALVNMPSYLSNPIFIFQRDEKTLGMLTEMKDRQNRNVCVAIEMNKEFQDGSLFLRVNDIRSFHGRRPENIIYPIIQNKSLVWVEKEKGLDWLTSASPNVQQEKDTSTLLLCTKIIKDFENPKQSRDYITSIDTNVLDRITDVSVYPIKNQGYAIRCKIDGVQQLAIKLTSQDAALVNPNMDKRLLASKYYKDELDMNEYLSVDNNQGLKR